MAVVKEAAVKKVKEKDKDCEIYWCSIDYEYNQSLDNVSHQDWSSYLLRGATKGIM